MQSSSDELSTLVSDSAKCKQTNLDTYELISERTLSRMLGWMVCHQPDVKLGELQSQFETSRVSSYTEELRYNG